MISQDRWGPCPFCGATGWWTPSRHIGVAPLNAHDRPQGGRCKLLAPSRPAAPPEPPRTPKGPPKGSGGS